MKPTGLLVYWSNFLLDFRPGFRSLGLQDVTQSFIVRRMLEGSRRDRITRDVRCSITMPTLKRLLFALPHVCISSYEVRLFRAAFIIAFFAFLRVGEFTVRARDHAPTLRLTDVNVRQGGGTCLELFIYLLPPRSELRY